ncbi:MAG: hypothetical protein KDD82_20220 [Planctomycetes bacterium]|nr:hypothetical protein [Planctomycetota bacterium]
MSARLPRAGACLALALGLAACHTPEPTAATPDPNLQERAGVRVLLRSDLPVGPAEQALRQLETLELLLDARLPFLALPGKPQALSYVIADPGRFELYAREFDVATQAGAFVAPGGVLFVRYRAEEQGPFGPPYVLEPPSRPEAAGALRRRLVLRYGPGLPRTWIEEGLALAFADLAARELGEEALAAPRLRQRLLDAYLPLFLGGPPALVDTLTRPYDPRAIDRRRVGAEAVAWACVRYLLADAEGTALLGRALEAWSREASPPEADLRALAARERDFERSLQREALEGLIDQLRAAPSAVDRWEAAAALRLLSNLDIEVDRDPEQLPARIARARQLLDEDPGPLRFLDSFAPQLARARAARSQFAALDTVTQRVRKEFERRTAGYGHPAVEHARGRLRAAVQWAIEHPPPTDAASETDAEDDTETDTPR